jgi:hypothetical protein
MQAKMIIVGRRISGSNLPPFFAVAAMTNRSFVFIYGLLYLFFTTIPSVFTQKYGFSVGLSGLAYLGR